LGQCQKVNKRKVWNRKETCKKQNISLHSPKTKSIQKKSYNKNPGSKSSTFPPNISKKGGLPASFSNPASKPLPNPS
jgi:hypothetical protein